MFSESTFSPFWASGGPAFGEISNKLSKSREITPMKERSDDEAGLFPSMDLGALVGFEEKVT